jgi:hypothetical protein
VNDKRLERVGRALDDRFVALHKVQDIEIAGGVVRDGFRTNGASG